MVKGNEYFTAGCIWRVTRRFWHGGALLASGPWPRHPSTAPKGEEIGREEFLITLAENFTPTETGWMLGRFARGKGAKPLS